MSADNILIILKKGDQFQVHDVNFSDISSHENWNFPITQEGCAKLTKYIYDNRYYSQVEYSGKSLIEAISFCEREARKRVIEYGHEVIVVE